MKRTPKTLIAGTLLLAGSLSLTATLLVNDPFAYGAADLASGYGSWQDSTNNVGYNGDAGNSSWAGDIDYEHDTSGGYLAVGVSNTYRGAQLDFGTAVSGEFWISVLAQERSSSGESGIMVSLENGAYSIGTFDGFGFGINGAGNLWTVANSASGAPTEVAGPVTLSSGWNLFVAKITVNGSGADDSISLWAFDTASSFGTTEASLGSALFTSSTIQYGDSVQDVWLGGWDGGPSGAGDFDTFRLSDLAGDAGLQEVLSVPEPSTYALLLGLGVLGGCLIRRRNRQ